MRPHLLVTNDFPPKVGGIQSYLWELWRRLPPASTSVLTTPHAQAAEFDAKQPMRVVRDRNRVLLPHRRLADRIRTLAQKLGAELVIYDPALPLGAIAARVGLPYGLVLHGAEVTVPARLPILRKQLAKVLNGAELIVCAGRYVADEAQRCAGRQIPTVLLPTVLLPTVLLPTVLLPPGVDTKRFVPLTPDQVAAARKRHGIEVNAPLVVGTSRLVPRKGFDDLIEAVAVLRRAASETATPGLADLQLAIAGTGRDAKRLAAISAKQNVPVRFLGRVRDAELPAVMGMGDVFAMPCRNRWGGLEQEGFGIVFLEAAAAGVCSVAGLSGGSNEAVLHDQTGLVVGRSRNATQLAAALKKLLTDEPLRKAMSAAARRRSEEEFDYDILADTLATKLAAKM